MERRSKSVPLFWIADSRCVFLRKSRNEVVLEERFKRRNRRNYSQNTLLNYRSSIYSKLDPAITSLRLRKQTLACMLPQKTGIMSFS